MRKMLFGSLGLISCLLIMSMRTAEAQAQGPRWEFAGWVGGGCYPNIEFDPNVKGRVYLTSDVAGIWRSDDLGESWESINNGLGNLNVSFVAVAPSDSNILYAGTKDGLFRSKDTGKTWKSCGNAGGEIGFRRPQSYQGVVISKKNPAFVVIGTAAGSVFVSSDYGDHWNYLSFGKAPFRENEPVSVLRFSLDERYLWVASRRGLLRYTLDDGRYEFLNKGPREMSDLFISKKYPKRIYAAGQKS